MKDTQEAALAVLGSTPAIVRSLLTGLPAEIVTAKLDRDWSMRMTLEHFVDVDPVYLARLQRIVEEDQPSIESIDVMARMAEDRYAGRSTESLLGEFATHRAKACAWIRTLTDQQLSRVMQHDTAGELTASNLLHYWPYHDLAHLRGIQRMIQAILAHEMGDVENMDV